MKFIKILPILTMIFFFSATNPCIAQSNLWEKFLELFRKEEPVTRITGKKRIEQGDTIKISWEIEDAQRIDIKGTKKDLDPIDSLKVSPDKTRYYQFHIHRNGEVERKLFRVEVYKPEIRYFNVPEKATDEEKVKISWGVRNAENVSIPGIADSLETYGKLTTYLNDSVLTLVAQGRFNTVKEREKIDFRYIENFNGTKKIYKGEKGQLTWKKKQTDSVRVKGFRKKFRPIDTLIVSPKGTRQYTLLVHRTSGSVDTIKHTMKVSPPEIRYFRGPKKVKKGQKATIRWEVAGVDTAWLRSDTAYKQVPLKGSRQVEINSKEKYTLIIHDKNDGYITKNMHIGLLPPREYITQIDTNRTRISNGLDFDIISVDQSDYPGKVKAQVVVVDTFGNYVGNLAQPYNEANPIKKYLHLSEKVKGKYHPSDYKIREVRHDTSEWFDISMVLDHSGSMYGIIGILQQATREFIKYKFPSDQISLVKFDHHIKTVSPLQSNKKEILDSLNLNGLQNFGGNTALYASIDQGIINLHQGRENKVLVAFTDGKENASFFYVGNRAYTAKQLAKKMKNKDIKLFIVSFGSFVDNKLLETLADVCGGKHYNIRRKNQIINVFKELPRIFRYYYEVTFRPESYKGEHQIHLTMTTPDGSIIQGKKSFFTGDDYTLFESASIPLYLLKEIPVRADILLNSPQVLARFDFDKHHLKTKYYPVVKSLLNYMKSSPEVKVLLAGHTDMIGSASYCLDLSRERAAEVKQYLAERGIEKSRIKTKACGKRHPVYKPEENEQEAKRNRRVEAVLYTD